MACGREASKYKWVRSKDIRMDFRNKIVLGGEERVPKPCVFDDTVSGCDVKQGELGDCYLLSAMTVIAHVKPHLIQKMFHP